MASICLLDKYTDFSLKTPNLSPYLKYLIIFFCIKDMTFLGSYWSRSTCDIYMNANDYEYVGKEHAIIIMNHKYDIDW